ncbi:MAG: hypothetical protein PSV35_07465 [bacterium]|nr:hypothetical protein [bacterium]
MGDDINNWYELITTQFFLGLAQITPNQFRTHFFNGLDKGGIIYKTTTFIEKPNRIIFELKVDQPKNLQQDETQKTIKNNDGLFILHYLIKKADMETKNRNIWLEHIKNSTLK